MSENELFRTGRLESMRRMTPAYQPGATVYLQRDLQGFAKGSAAWIISVETEGPGVHRYQLTVGDQKMWSFETDIRPTPPRSSALLDKPGAEGALGPTQRMSTMTHSQRMAALGPDSTQRMHAMTQEERLQKMVQTNRMRTMGSAGQPAASQARPPGAEAPASVAPSVAPSVRPSVPPQAPKP